MRRHATVLGMGLLLATVSPIAIAWAATTPAETILLEQADYWRLRDRPQQALEALARLLASNPTQPDALYQAGMLEAQRGGGAAAQQYLDRFKQVAPSDPRIATLANAISVGKIDQADVNDARRLAQTGNAASAVQRYQQAFKGATPTPALQLEYYQTLAGTDQGYDEAKDGLARLQASDPSPLIKLAYGRVLTYREATRRDGIKILSRLVADSSVGTEANTALRQGLLWLGATPKDRPFYDEYLARVPGDAEVQKKLQIALNPAVASPQDAGDQARMEGFDALKHGEAQTAATEFEKTLKLKPNDPDALGGLGVVRLREGRFGEARALLERAVAAQPADRAKWSEALDAATFYGGLADARAARSQNNLARAEAILIALLKTPHKDQIQARQMLADVEARRGAFAAAETQYRAILAQKPNDTDAAVGLYNALVRQNRANEAMQLAERMNPDDRARVSAGLDKSKAELSRAEAKAAEAAHNDLAAMTAYQRALVADPNSPWLRLDFARFLARQGETDQARSMMAALDANPAPDAAEAQAIFASEQDRPSDALALLDRIPANKRNADVKKLRDQLVTKQAIRQAVALADAGRQPEARAMLGQLAAAPPQSAEKTSLVAAAFADIGDNAAALQTVRNGMGSGRQRVSASQSIEYLKVLSKTGQQAEAQAYIRQLDRDPTLSPADRSALEQVKVGMVAQRANALTDRGDYAGAYDVLAPQLSASSNDKTLLMSMARVYQAGKRPAEALQIYQSVLQTSPRDIDAIRGAIGAAIDVKDLKTARTILTDGIAYYPNNPQLYYLSAQIARSDGDTRAAIRDLETAQNLNRQQNPNPDGSMAPGQSGVRNQLPPNPFRSTQNPSSNSRSALPDDDDHADRQAMADTAPRANVAQLPRDDADIPTAPGPQVADASGAATAGAVQVADAPYPLTPYDPAAPTPRRRVTAQPRNLSTPPDPTYYGTDTYQPVPANAPSQVFGAQPANNPPAPRSSLDRDIERSLEELRAQASPTIEGQFVYRGRDGEAGLGQLTSLGANVIGSTPLGRGTARVTVSPEMIESGTPANDTNTLRRIGSNSLLTNPAQPGDSRNWGVGLNGAYSIGPLTVDVGTTPLGFAKSNLVGGVSFTPTIFNPETRLILEGSRRAVTESVLSYAGMRDPGQNGQVFGAVVKNGGKLGLAYDNGDFGAYGTGGYYNITGTNVATNNNVEVNVGTFIRPYRTDTDSLKVGVNLNYLNYDKNLSYFTFGQGGYFSPQNYANLSFPIEYEGKSGRFSYDVTVSPGIQTFNQKSVAYYPNNPNLQAQLVAAAATDSTIKTAYAAHSSTGFGIGASAKLEYQVDPKTVVGGKASFDNTRDYSETTLMVYLRRAFSWGSGVASNSDTLR
ncbi:MAG TPA: cellulose synthase subunit BcsC-related outer membrane protein [Stellaceae bacterium]|nr:cellulose synthase subunit BcsC-related outer membrane protein [Stellaceae bacterium]